MPDQTALTALNYRVWCVKGGVHPLRAPELLALGKISTAPSQSIGEATKISAPDPESFNKDIQIGNVPGETARATLSIGVRSTVQRSILLDWAHSGCRVDIFALIGRCGNPQDFTDGGEKWLYFPDGQISQHSFENVGAWGRDENNPANEMVDMTAQEYIEFLKERMEQVAASVTSREIASVDYYTGNECENCPETCDRIILTMIGANATPGTQPSILYSSDSGQTWAQQIISTLFSNESIGDAHTTDGNFLLVSPTALEIHWTQADKIFTGDNTWNQIGTGFVAGKAPRKMAVYSPRHIWICGDGGYIYFTSNFKTGVLVQDAGVATTQNLNAISAYDKENVLSVGNSNAVVFTRNGIVWESVTGPAVGINLGACWMWSPEIWFVGEGAGGTGKLWLTVNAGKTWTQVALPATYLRIDKIVFITEAEGYMLARDGGQEYILRTITAGNEWVVLPQGKTGTPTDNAWLNDLDVCNKYANRVIAGGVAPNGTSGIAILAAG